MAELEIDDSDLRKLELQLSRLAPAEINRRLPRVVRATAKGSITPTSKKVRELYTIKAGPLKKRIAVRDVNVADRSFVLRGFKSTIGIRNFSASQNKRGVSVRVLKGSARTQLRAAFGPASGLNANPVFFTRLSPRGEPLPFREVRAGSNRGKVKQQLRAIKGPSAADMLNRDEVESAIADFAAPRYATELQRAIDRALRGF